MADEPALYARLELRITDFEKQLAKAQRAADTGMRQIQQRADQTSKSLANFGANFAKGLGPGLLGGIIGGAAIETLTKLPELIRKTVAEGAGLVDTANKVGLTTDALQELHFAATQGGASVEDMDQALAVFAKGIGEASQGAGQLHDVLKLNNVALTDSSGKIRPAADLLRDYANLVKNAGSEQERARLVMIAFGRSGADLANVFRDGADGLDVAAAAAYRLGTVVSEGTLARIADIDDKWDAFATTLDSHVRQAILGTVEVADTLATKLQDLGRDLAAFQSGAQRAPEKFGNLVGSMIDPAAGDDAMTEYKRASATTQQLADAKALLVVRLNRLAASGPSKDGFSLTPERTTQLSHAKDPAASTKRTPEQQFDQSVASIKARTDALNAETEAQAGVNPLVDDYGYAVTKAKTAQDLLSDAQREGVAVTPALAQQIDATATSYADASVAAAKLREQQQRISQEALEIRDFGKDALGGFIDDLKAGKTAGEALTGVLQKIATKLEDITLDWLFGGGTSGSTFGAIGKVLGFAEGGYTGSGGRDQPAGIVHRGEYVFDKAATSRIGIGNLEAIRRGMVGYAAGGAVDVPNIGVPRSRLGASGPQTFVIKLDGARGNLEIEEAARRGANAAIAQSRADLTQYDKGLTSNLQRRQQTGR